MARHERRDEDSLRRAIALALVVLLLVLAGVANSRVRHSRAVAAIPANSGVAFVELSHPASSAAWYCPGPIPLGAGASGRVEVANLSSRPLEGTLAIAETSGDRQVATSRSVRVAARSLARFALPVPKAGGYGAATVLLDGSGAAVSEIVRGPAGADVTPCLDAPSSASTFAGGSTRLAANVALGLYDPGATPAVANVTVLTDEGPLEPPALQGIPVEAGALALVNVGEYVPQEAGVSLLVTSTGGRLAMGALYSDVLAGARSLSLVVGSSSTADEWYLAAVPSGVAATGVLTLVNPGSTTSEVEATLLSSAGPASAETEVDPHSSAVLAVARDATPGALRAVVLSAEGAGVVVVRRTTLVAPLVQSAPGKGAARTVFSLPQRLAPGIAVDAAVAQPGEHWLLPGGEVDSRTGEVVTLVNPSAKAAVVRLSALGAPAAAASALARLGALHLAPGAAAAIDLARYVGSAPDLDVVVASDEPVVPGEELYARGSKGSVGFSASAAIPIE